MKRIFVLTAALLAAGVSFAGPAAAQTVDRSVPNVALQRPVLDTSVLLQRLRDRGVAEDKVQTVMARIRAAIASGNYPHLERRLYNALHPDETPDGNRRRYLQAGTDTEAEANRRRYLQAGTDADVAERPASDVTAVRSVNTRAPVRGETQPAVRTVRNR